MASASAAPPLSDRPANGMELPSPAIVVMATMIIATRSRIAACRKTSERAMRVCSGTDPPPKRKLTSDLVLHGLEPGDDLARDLCRGRRPRRHTDPRDAPEPRGVEVRRGVDEIRGL